MAVAHNPPFRPDAIKNARDAHHEGRISHPELRAIEDEEIRKVIAMQESVGLKVATDGEFRRSTYSENFTTQGLTGVRSEHVGSGDWA